MSITRSSFKQSQQSTNDLKQNIKKYAFYVIVDPLSGIACGRSLLNLQSQKICFLLNNQQDQAKLIQKQPKFKWDVHVNISNINNQKSLSSVFDSLKSNNLQKSRKNRLIVCGNQSTIDQLVMQAKKCNFSIQNIPIGLIPSGLDNDLSTVLGWGQSENKDLVGNGLKQLKNLVRKWISGIVQKIDLWRIQFEVHDQQGEIEAVNKYTQAKYYQKQKIISKYMISHLSFGAHARIGLGFEQKKNSDSIFANRIIYAFQNLKKTFCMKTAKIQKTIAVAQIFHSGSEGDYKIQKTLFTRSNSKSNQKKQSLGLDDTKYLQNSPVSLVCLNINCFQGVLNIWKDAKQTQKTQNFYNQNYYDGKLQFVTFDSTYSKQSKKICQSEGNIIIKMQRQLSTYLQIDNFCYKLIEPKQVRIFKDSKLQILINSQSLK